jgi:hypothetical protein
MTQHEATRRIRTLRQSAALGLLLLFPVPAAYSYSVLTHEAIIDSTVSVRATHLFPRRRS